MRVLTIISGIIFVLAGAFCAINPGETFLALAFIVGAVMLISSVIQAIAYMQGRGNNRKDNNGWILAEAMLTFLLGILVLMNQVTADVAVPMVFGMWVMCSGILRVVSASQINRKQKKSNFLWTLIIGIICILGGLYAFVNLNMMGLSIALLLSLLFVLQGISILELGIHMPHEKKEKRLQEQREREMRERKAREAALKQQRQEQQKTEEVSLPMKKKAVNKTVSKNQ